MIVGLALDLMKMLITKLYDKFFCCIQFIFTSEYYLLFYNGILIIMVRYVLKYVNLYNRNIFIILMKF